MPATGDFLPSASITTLKHRAKLLQAVRSFFEQRDFFEVDTPILSTDCVVDQHLDPFSVTLFRDPRRPNEGSQNWLQTSPEFAMKRLMVAGASAIFQITRAFRAGESGRLHNPEFTILEWYRQGDDQEAGIQLLADLCEALLPFGRPKSKSYGEAFRQYLAIDPHVANIDALRATAFAQKIALPEAISDDRNEWLNLLLTECIEPHLGFDTPVIIYDYPAEQAALSIVRDGTPPVAERFELYVQGIELANGYHELLDADELLQRNQETNRRRRNDGKPPLPDESRLLQAMRHGLPPCAGVALGFDRLLMLAVGAQSIDEVIAFPIDRA